jgi:transcriptional regulator with XRE-family HTH domain
LGVDGIQALVAALRDVRLRKGLSQADVAAQTGTTQSAIARLESGSSDPRLSTVQRYAEAVGARLAAPTVEPGPSLEQTAADVQMSLHSEGAGEALRQVIQFLDEVKAVDSASVRDAVRVEPDSTGDRRWDALLAGVAEYVSRRAGLRVPGWTAAPGRFLDRFWFVIEDILGRPAPGLAAAAFVSSPAELAGRGVFLDRSSLVSV